MGEFRDSSLLFSLESLIQAERERVVEEQRALERAELERQQREREALLEQQRAEERRLLEEQQRREQQAAKEREERARLEAIRAAEVERVRLEIERRNQLEILRRREQQEQKLAAIRAAAQKGTSRYLWLIVGVFSLGALAAAGLYFGHFLPQQQRVQASQTALLGDMRARTEQASELIREAERRREAADLARRELEQQLRQLEEKPPPKQSSRPVTAPPRRPSSPAPRKPCNPEDPMDFCLGR